MPRKTWVGHLTTWLEEIELVDEHGHRVHVTPQRAAGHDRIAEKNTKILNNLDKIIDACENCDDGEVVLGGKVAQLDDAS